MALFPVLDTENSDFRPDSAMRLPLGAASPLWFAFASAASAGVAYWWMTRWTQPAHLEALGDWFAPKTQTSETSTPQLALVAQPSIETPVEAALEPVEAAAEVVVETVATLAEPVTEAVDEAVAVSDDLTRLVGVGPRLAERLAGLGVQSFKDIAGWTDEDLAKFDKALDLKGRAVRDAWVAQARRFAEA